jgi:haloalkane dehalogenase
VPTVEPPGPGGARVGVLGSWMRYVDVGDGPPVLFLHGNPTSSFLWRDVVAPVARAGWRCVAVDLIGMGGSGRPDIDYRLVDHVRFLDAFLDAIRLPPAVVVGHDWGAVMAIDLLGRRPDRVRGVAFLEGHLHPVHRWSDLDPGARELFTALRTPDLGEQLVLGDNVVVEQVLPSGVLRTLTPAEMAAYRAPFREPGHRRPTLRWAREIPVEGHPADVTALVERNQHVLSTSPAPTLLLHATPGALVTRTEVDWCRSRCPRLDVVHLGPGTHFLPEDRPAEIAAALTAWLPATGRRSGPVEVGADL